MTDPTVVLISLAGYNAIGITAIVVILAVDAWQNGVKKRIEREMLDAARKNSIDTRTAAETVKKKTEEIKDVVGGLSGHLTPPPPPPSVLVPMPPGWKQGDPIPTPPPNEDAVH